ncbi:hypothetical protein [Helicobacter japonicus]|uniref:hypothetical protein n=1 Tax=Helicobacter japonicus TaxID=425400 RepID=UPI0023F461FB|nr:hypothetical protein [Helicobacter japonicus]
MKMYGVFGVCFGIFAALLFWQISVIDTKVQNRLLQNHLANQNKAIKEQALQKEEIESYNAQSKHIEQEFLSAYYTSHNLQQIKEYESYGDAADSTTAALKQLQEVEYALEVFYASSP